MRYGVTVDSYGKCLHNKDFPGGGDVHERTLARYKFLLVLEPFAAEDYVTESFYRALALGVVPVYLGAPNAAQRFAPGRRSFVRVDAFGSTEQLAHYLRWLDDHDDEYAKLLAWKTAAGGVPAPLGELVNSSLVRVGLHCRLCLRAHERLSLIHISEPTRPY